MEDEPTVAIGSDTDNLKSTFSLLLESSRINVIWYVPADILDYPPFLMSSIAIEDLPTSLRKFAARPKLASTITTSATSRLRI